MTFLELVNRFLRESGSTAATLSTLSGVSGEALRAKEWIQQSWTELQLEHPTWDWMRKSVSFTTTASQQAYTPSDAAPTGAALSDFGAWVPDSFRCYLTASGTADEQFLAWRGYDEFRDLWIFSSFRTTTSRPIDIAQRASDHALLLGPVPGAVYTVVGEYFATPTELSASTDEPAMPSRYHMAIVYRALMEYGAFEAAPEVYQRGELKFNEMMRRMEFDQLPDVLVGSPLA